MAVSWAGGEFPEPSCDDMGNVIGEGKIIAEGLGSVTQGLFAAIPMTGIGRGPFLLEGHSRFAAQMTLYFLDSGGMAFERGTLGVTLED